MAKKKLGLDAESLSVESFETGAVARLRGTVQGYVCTGGATCYCYTARYYCGTDPRTKYSCPNTEIGNTCESWATEDC